MNNSKQKFYKLAAVLMMATALSGCNTWSRLSNIGKEPDLAPIQNPVEAPGQTLYGKKALPDFSKIREPLKSVIL